MGGHRSGKRKKMGIRKREGGDEYTTSGNRGRGRGRGRGKRKMRKDDILGVVKKINK